MYTHIMEEMNAIALMKANEHKPDLTKFDNGKKFLDLYYSGIEFYQVFYYDKTDGMRNKDTIKFNIDADQVDNLMKELEFYIHKLKEEQEKVISEFKLSESGRQTYLSFNRVGEDLGYCHVSIHRRYLKDEEAELIDIN